ncbi:SLC2A4 regulator isoform X6 [Cavia porcellus]|uniref:SLC2A4 regulator isoform X6 n=1 Tax=Cavia porcellus TaxID=10141 RepID=UPI002FE2628A
MASGLRKLWALRAWQWGAASSTGACLWLWPSRAGGPEDASRRRAGGGAGGGASRPPEPPREGAGSGRTRAGAGPRASVSTESPASAGPARGQRCCGLGVSAAAGAAGREPRDSRDLGGGRGGAADAFGANPRTSAESPPRKSTVGRGHGCGSPNKPVHQPPLSGGPSYSLQPRARSRSCSSACGRTVESRQAEPEQSDGEEDFYYTELDVGVDALTNGLSSLTPMTPTATVPPAFPHLELPELLKPPALPSLLQPLALALAPPPMLNSVAPQQVCHSDHAHQVGEATGGGWEQVSGRCGDEQGPGYNSPQDLVAPIHLELRATEVRACTPALPSKLGANLRKPRGDAKKCRKVYGMDHRDLWCTACRWKKACQRFLD